MCFPWTWFTKHAQLIMGTWPIYKNLQLILTKKLSFDKISPRDFYFFPFFSICTCFHNVIGLPPNVLRLPPKPRTLHYKSYKTFDESVFLNSVASASFHVIDSFDEIDNMAWNTSALMRNIIDEHAPMKTKVVKCDSVPYNSALPR